MILMLTSEDLNCQLAKLREIGLQTYLIKPIKRTRAARNDRPPAGRRWQMRLRRSMPAASTPLPAVDVRPLRILLADDSTDNCELIRAYFKSLPYELEVADNGLIAIDKFKASPHDLVLMDVRMPEMDG